MFDTWFWMDSWEVNTEHGCVTLLKIIDSKYRLSSTQVSPNLWTGHSVSIFQQSICGDLTSELRVTTMIVDVIKERGKWVTVIRD